MISKVSSSSKILKSAKPFTTRQADTIETPSHFSTSKFITSVINKTLPNISELSWPYLITRQLSQPSEECQTSPEYLVTVEEKQRKWKGSASWCPNCSLTYMTLSKERRRGHPFQPVSISQQDSSLSLPLPSR